MNNYQEVPTIISSKDLDYLSDMFNWNYEAYKKSFNSLEKISDGEIKQKIEKVSNYFHDTLVSILNILGGKNEQSNM